MLTLILAVAIVGQPEQVYRFRTLEPAPGQRIHMQAAPPESPVTDRIKHDPFGFTTWSNATRRMYGLPPLTYDHSLTLWARRNNIAQRENGKAGHFVMGAARRQNSNVITGDISPYIGSEWMGSDGHRTALLDPTITRYGIAWDGAYWTWNAR